MDAAPRTWHVERTVAVRADADGLFVRLDHLPGAAIGDAVSIIGHDGGDVRTGTIVATTYHDETAFFRLVLDPVS